MGLANIGSLVGSTKEKMMLNDGPVEQPKNIFRDNSWGLRVCLFIKFLLATLLRLDEIKAPGHLLDREYTSALFARAYYFSNNEAVEHWRRDIAITTKNQQPTLEPPLLEYLVSLIYRLVDREEIFFARYLTNAFWIVGGIFMYLIAKKLLSTDAAVVANAYYLFVPMGIISRSFIPEYFVITNFELFHRKDKDLEDYLEKNCSMYVHKNTYWIYGCCNFAAIP